MNHGLCRGTTDATIVPACTSLDAEALRKDIAVTGGRIEGIEGDGLLSFKGIPFAAPPVGELRWRAPQPVVPWDGVKVADAFAPGPIQDLRPGTEAPRSEDCLYLNLWTGAKAAGERRPVMVWIYGGAFMNGMTSLPVYDGTTLAKKGVVLVSIAYRVGPFGFLAHPELSAESGAGSGCYGIMDLIAGLQWVKANIAAFGGTPDNVTIFGESAGGIATSMLAASPKAAGLFHKIISQSGGSFAPPMYGNEAGQNVPSLSKAEKLGMDFLEGLGAGNLEAARKLDAQAIQRATAGRMLFWPAADGEYILGDQHELYEAGKFNDTPILIGTNSDEGASFIRPGATGASFEKEIRSNFGPAAEDMLKVYPHATDAEAYKSSKDIFREQAFAWHTWTWAELQSARGRNRAFVYFLDARGPTMVDGTPHGFEIAYVFGNLGKAPEITPADRALSDLVVSYWVNFARSGDPNDAGLPTWRPYEASRRPVMILGYTPRMGDLPHQDKLAAFDAYYAWRRTEAAKRR